MKMILALAVLLCVAGCSREKSFADRIKGADRLVATYPSDGLSITIKGDELSKVIQAIANGKKESPTVDCSPYLQFQFFSGTQHLAAVTTCGQVFWIGKQPYSDRTGTFEAVTQKYREAHPPLLSP